MKCLMKYPWVKLPRNRIPAGKGIMGAWMRLAARAAFRKGEARYCGYNNPVEPGMWVGGIVGLILSSHKTAFVKDKIILSAKMFIFGGNSRTKPDKSEYKAGWPRARICLVFPFFVMIKA